MAVAAVMLISEPQSDVFLDIFHKADTNQLAIGMPPHISLAVFDEVDVQQLDHITEQFSHKVKPLDVWMSSIAMFPNEHPVVYAQPVITSALLDLHRLFHLELGDLVDCCWNYYKPDSWSPHLTLGTTESLASALEIISVAYDAKLQGNYSFDKISLVEFHPVKIIASYPVQEVEKEVSYD